MTTIKINEQIAFLRKQKGLTQEDLANALGVTNQAVSKWESAQCCPDIQLLPAIAKLFEVSVDELLGYTPISTSENITLALRKKINSLSKGDDFDFAFRMAAALHTIILSKEMTAGPNANPGWDTDDAIEHAGNAEWGYSCCSIPKITTTMRHGAVFFSNNKNLFFTNADIRRLSAIIKPFSDTKNLTVATTLYQLTVHSEDAYATVGQICEKSGMSEEKVQECLKEYLAPFLSERNGAETEFRFSGMYMNIIPIISLLNYN